MILTQQRTIDSGTLEYAQVAPRDVPWLDTSFYDEVSNKMARCGFRRGRAHGLNDSDVAHKVA